MNIEQIKEKGWELAVDNAFPGRYKNASYPGVLLVPAQISNFYLDEGYRKNILSARNVMDVFFNKIFKDLP